MKLFLWALTAMYSYDGGSSRLYRQLNLTDSNVLGNSLPPSLTEDRDSMYLLNAGCLLTRPHSVTTHETNVYKSMPYD